MITITRRNDGFTVKGHAGYAPIGQDIVCAGVSTLVQAFLVSVDELTSDKINSVIEPGNALVNYENLSAQSEVLVASLFIGLGLIAHEYPDYVRIQ